MNAEPLDVDVDTEQRLDDTDDQEGDVVSASPEAPAKSRNYRGRQEGQPGKAAEVVAVCDVASADRSRGEVVAQEARNEEREPQPDPNLLAAQCLLASPAGLGRRGLWFRLRRPHVRRCGRGASVRRDGVGSFRLLREVGDVALAFVFH